MELKGRKVLITGASRGIGAALAELLAAEGAELILVGRDETRLKKQAQRLASPAVAMAAELSRPGETHGLVERTMREHPDLAVLVNNAAVQTEMDFAGGSYDSLADDSRAEIAINLAAPVTITAGLIPLLRQQPRAVVMNVTTALALAPKQAAPVYCATKSGLRSFTRALRYQCEDAAPNLRICETVMALVDTDMTRGRGRGKISPHKAAEAIAAGIVTERAETWVGKARLLPLLNHLFPALVRRMLR